MEEKNANDSKKQSGVMNLGFFTPGYIIIITAKLFSTFYL